MTTNAFLCDVPYLSVKEYARRAGETEDVIYHLVNSGKLPTMPRDKAGEKIYINVALANQRAIEQAH